MTITTPVFRSRNRGIRRVRVADIRDNESNFREHPDDQAKALNEAETLLGFYGYPDVYIEPDGGVKLVDGELRKYHLLAKYGADHEIDVNETDFTPEEAKLALLTKDPLTAMAKTNKERLDGLMQQFDATKATLDPSILESLQGGLDKMLAELAQTPSAAGSGGNQSVKLADRFLVPPFSVLDARQGYWQDRKRWWLALGIQSEVGRGENLLQFSDTVRLPARRNMASPMNSGGCTDDVSQRINSTVRGGPRPGGGVDNRPARPSGQYGGGDAFISRRAAAQTYGSGGPGDMAAGFSARAINDHQWQRDTLGNVQAPEQGTGTSIFDPVLCEIAYKWFCPQAGAVLDPFAGGSVRGIVAGKLGLEYLGVDLRPEQIEANQIQAMHILAPPDAPAWTVENDVCRMPLTGETSAPGQSVRGHWHIPGGTKQAVLERLMPAWPEEEVVYASPAYGFAQIAVAAAAQACGKRATIVVAKRNEKHPRTQLAERLGATIIEVEHGRLNVVQARAREHCQQSGGRLVPFGCDFPEFVEALAGIIRESGDAPPEAWCCAGSGVLSRAIRQAWPESSVVAVQVGRDPEIGGARLIEAPEAFEDDAVNPPAFPSCSNYDAKVWQFFKDQAGPGAVYWNVGADGVGLLPDRFGTVEWRAGDSRTVIPTITREFDLIFSCPPYADLELYSDDPLDISNMPYEQFLEAYREIIRASCQRLRDNRFAVWVIGEVRGGEGGTCRGLVQDTVQAFRDAGMSLYNDAILVTSCGSLPLRVGRQFVISRKLGRTHQYVLVFCKGDPRLATEACGPVVMDEAALAKLAEEQGLAAPEPAGQTENGSPSTLEPSA